MERIDLMAKAIEDAYETMQKNPADSDKHKEAAETFKSLCRLAIEEKKNDYDEYMAEQKLDVEKAVKMKEAETKLKEVLLKIEQFEYEKKYRWLPSGDALFIGGVIIVLTGGTYTLEALGVMTPKALAHVKTLFRFI